ncbi:hypothetical protein [Burkholderia pseudomallei]|uniref:hypothetical protein n=1 Tax=Burkholderia pseudomallei TaxID=28450 RepID=UPI0009777625|nr:hypothetical protein [Burkholderia pseudomallei]OMQ57088.1 hypothetical protein AQ709_26680 [Burkholderia pseudomallei]OMQ65154.1 hypothetical protein AQ712_13090 [Burkholderia pseudomallei]OMQ72885.1 hypothetical protein AQ711_02550 [Burkholderia pseudomallei]
MNDQSAVEQAVFHEWMRDVATIAFAVGHIDRRWRATNAQCDSLKGYFDAGLTAAEADEALFAVRH